MVVHVGFEWDNGIGKTFNGFKNATFTIAKFPPKNNAGNDFIEEQIKYICEKIKSMNVGEGLGCLCISLKKGYCNNVRIKMIQCFLDAGFKTVEIIDFITAIYFSAITEIYYKPKNDEEIWIINGQKCDVWKIENNVAQFDPELSDEYSNGIYKKVIEKMKFHLQPNVIFINEDTREMINKLNIKCPVYSIKYNDAPRGALKKAQIMTKDPKIEGFDAFNRLNRRLTFKKNDEIFLVLNEEEKIPLKKLIRLVASEAFPFLKISDANVQSEIALPNYKEFFFFVKIDKNGIYKIEYEKIPSNPAISIDNYVDAVYYETMNHASNALDYTLIKKFCFLKTPNLSKNVIGIHLGNWECSAATCLKISPKPIALGDNGELTISPFLFFSSDEEAKCGLGIFDGLIKNASSVFDVKTFIGKNISEINIQKNWPFKISNLQKFNDPFLESMKDKLQINFKVGVEIDDEIVKSPEDIYANLLKYIRAKIEECHGTSAVEAVITVPQIFTESQKISTRISALLAGWESVSLIPESVATILSFFYDFLLPQNVPMILFDLGDAFLNVCIFEMENDKIKIIHSFGDDSLGGRDFDKLLIDYFYEEIKQKYNFEISKELWSKFVFYCKDIKHVLSFRDRDVLYLEDLDITKSGYVDITRKHFQRLSETILDKIQDLICENLIKAKFEAAKIGRVFLTGGGSRMPMIKLMLRETFPKAKHYSNDFPPEEITVAVGAARFASTTSLSSPESTEDNATKEKIDDNDVEINAIGIDLGTTRCCLAVNRRIGIDSIGLENTGERLLPSYVAYDEKHEKCGKVAIDRLRNNAKSTAFDSKRLIGKEMSEIQIDQSWTFTLIPFGPKVKLQLTTFEGEALKYPEEISTSLLKYMKQKAEEFQCKKFAEVVITIPAQFNIRQEKSTYVAAILAGWKKVTLISESAAAAIAYFNHRPLSVSKHPSESEPPTVLLFDLGGGTLDVCVFQIDDPAPKVQIIGQHGDLHLGGRDFDNLLIEHFNEMLQNDFGVEAILESKRYLLMTKCQEIKEYLSENLEDSLEVDDFDIAQDGRITINRAQFEELALPLLERTRAVVFEAVRNANFTADKIDKVIQVGGGCRMPMIKQLIQSIFPNSEHCCVTNPDEMVAIGAAHYSFNLSTQQ